MKIISKISIVFALMCITATAAFSQQDCNSYLNQAAELVSQKNYCDALTLYRKYRDCNADADVSTEIAMCERRCKLAGGTVEPEAAKQPAVNTTTTNSSVVQNTAPAVAPSGRNVANNRVVKTVSSSTTVDATPKFKIGVNGGLLYPTKKADGAARTYLFFGGGISGEYLIIPQIGIGLSAGFYGYGLEKTEGGVKTTTITTLIPVALTGRFYFLTKKIQPYAGVDVGYYTLGVKSGGESYSESFFGLAPVIGLQYKLSKSLALDVNVKYNYYFSKKVESIDIKPADMLGFNVGLVYAFGK